MALRGMTAVAIGLGGIVLFAMTYAVIQAANGNIRYNFTACF